MKLMLSNFREPQENLEDEVLKVPKDQGFVLLLFFACAWIEFTLAQTEITKDSLWNK